MYKKQTRIVPSLKEVINGVEKCTRFTCPDCGKEYYYLDPCMDIPKPNDPVPCDCGVELHPE
jgi:predicted RNA-binding Zn-ribbon protein involved in translation (DUF1610 family)